jgi:hypothetical protein
MGSGSMGARDGQRSYWPGARPGRRAQGERGEGKQRADTNHDGTRDKNPERGRGQEPVI